jgi:hypothetical protein
MEAPSFSTAAQSLRIRLRGANYSASIAALLTKAADEAERDCIALVISNARWLSSPRGGAPCDASDAGALLGRFQRRLSRRYRSPE